MRKIQVIVKNINMMTRIFIVDDHEIVRRGLLQFLNSREEFEVCGEAADANRAISGLNKCSCDIAIVDINLEGISGIDLIKAIRERYKNILILALSMYSGSENVERALKAGAMGYVLKSEPADQIIDGMRSILEGKTYISPQLKDNLLNKMIKNTEEEDISLNLLTNREFEIFRLIGEGSNRMEISRKLNLNTSTIGTYRDRIKSKLNISSPAELTRQAVEWVVKNQE